MAKKISQYEDIAVISGDTKVLGYDPQSNKTGMINVMTLINKDQWCGVRWRLDSTSPVGEPEGDIDMLRELPFLLNLGGYLVKNDHSRRKLSRQTHYKYADGSPAKLDGSEGHYMWGWDKPWYYAVFNDSTYRHVRFAFTPMKGCLNYRVPVASRDASGFSTVDRTNSILVAYCNKAAQYRGGANTAADDATWKSGLGKPACSIAANAFQRYAEKNGGRWAASHMLINTATAVLCLLIFHNRDIQAAFNPSLDKDGLHQGGLGSGTSHFTDIGYFGDVPKDAGAELGDALCVFDCKAPAGAPSANWTGIPNFFGLKNFYHNMTAILHGVLFNGTGKEHNIYVEKVWTEKPVQTDSTSGMKLIGAYKNAGEAAWFYPKVMNFIDSFFWAADNGGSSSTGYCDGQYLESDATTGLRAPGALLGAVGGSDCGPFAFGADYGVSTAYVHFGAFLCEAAENWQAEPTTVS